MPKRAAKLSAMHKPKDPEGSRADILEAATAEFAARGLDGARIDAIARQMRTTRAMVYYYFGNKEELYLAVLMKVYRGIRDAEKQLDLAHLPPLEAMRQLVTFTFDYFQAHPEFVALVVAENQSGARHIRKMHAMHRLNVSIVDTINEVLERGRREGVFRHGFDAIELHMTIVALGWFQIANGPTFGYLFKRNMASAKTVRRHRELVTDVVCRFVRASQGDEARHEHRVGSPRQSKLIPDTQMSRAPLVVELVPARPLD